MSIKFNKTSQEVCKHFIGITLKSTYNTKVFFPRPSSSVTAWKMQMMKPSGYCRTLTNVPSDWDQIRSSEKLQQRSFHWCVDRKTELILQHWKSIFYSISHKLEIIVCKMVTKLITNLPYGHEKSKKKCFYLGNITAAVCKMAHWCIVKEFSEQKNPQEL